MAFRLEVTKRRMVEIKKSVETKANNSEVWKIVSDLDNEHKNWDLLRDVKILGKKDNSVDREVKIRRGPMGEANSIQTLTIDPAKKVTILTMTGGPMLGTRKISLHNIADSKTRIDVDWKFEMKGVPSFALSFVEDNISKVTEESLQRIAEQAAHSLSAVSY